MKLLIHNGVAILAIAAELYDSIKAADGFKSVINDIEARRKKNEIAREKRLKMTQEGQLELSFYMPSEIEIRRVESERSAAA